MQLTNVGCSGSESNLTSCCASEISSSVYCHSGAYAGVRCKLHHVYYNIIWSYIYIHTHARTILCHCYSSSLRCHDFDAHAWQVLNVWKTVLN